MIYLVDEKMYPGSHSHYMTLILKRFTSTDISHVEIDVNDINAACSILENLSASVNCNDIIFCPWQTKFNNLINWTFERLVEKCFVIVPAGNDGGDIEHYSPTNVPGLIVVGSLNRDGHQASHSNKSEKISIEWIRGTSYNFFGKILSGTSYAAASYTAVFAESINKRDIAVVDELRMTIDSSIVWSK